MTEIFNVNKGNKNRRELDKNKRGNQLGFRVFQEYYRRYTTAKKQKKYEDFIGSSLYDPFVKFGNFLTTISKCDIQDYIDYVFSSGLKIDEWYKYDTYYEFLNSRLTKEAPADALERATNIMEKWCQKNNVSLGDFYKEVGIFEALNMIETGKISPWVFLLSEKSYKLFDRMPDELMKSIESKIDIKRWKLKFTLKKEETKMVEEYLKTKGI